MSGLLLCLCWFLSSQSLLKFVWVPCVAVVIEQSVSARCASAALQAGCGECCGEHRQCLPGLHGHLPGPGLVPAALRIRQAACGHTHAWCAQGLADTTSCLIRMVGANNLNTAGSSLVNIPHRPSHTLQQVLPRPPGISHLICSGDDMGCCPLRCCSCQRCSESRQSRRQSKPEGCHGQHRGALG